MKLNISKQDQKYVDEAITAEDIVREAVDYEVECLKTYEALIPMYVDPEIINITRTLTHIASTDPSDVERFSKRLRREERIDKIKSWFRRLMSWRIVNKEDICCCCEDY